MTVILLLLFVKVELLIVKDPLDVIAPPFGITEFPAFSLSITISPSDLLDEKVLELMFIVPKFAIAPPRSAVLPVKLEPEIFIVPLLPIAPPSFAELFVKVEFATSKSPIFPIAPPLSALLELNLLELTVSLLVV